MRWRTIGALLVGGCLAVGLFAGVRAEEEEHELGPYRFLGTIKVPGDLAGGFDISWVDADAGRYYVTDRGTTSVDVINTRRNTFLSAIPLHAAGNGVVAIHPSHDDDEDKDDAGELWVGDANSFVEVIDLKTRTIVADIATHGKARADELAFDPRDHIVVIANDRDNPPFLSFISTKTRTVLGTLSYPQTVFGTPPTGHGLEQPVWDARTRRFYLAVPATAKNPHGEVDEINPLTRMVTRVFPTTCNPAGLVLVPGHTQRLVTSCGDILSVSSGAVLKTVAGVGGDEIWFNPGDERVYFGGGTNFISVPVVDTDSETLVTTLTVGVALTPITASHITHSVAADSENNRIFVPVSHEGVKVYTDAKREDDDE